tara:strand:- start:56 stop:175 length:120 start_codon:yes stop_codon:yes gene_type:complete
MIVECKRWKKAKKETRLKAGFLSHVIKILKWLKPTSSDV